MGDETTTGKYTKQMKEFQGIMDNDDFTLIIVADRRTAPPRRGSNNKRYPIYGKERLIVSEFELMLPARKVIHHKDGDVSFLTEYRGAFRFCNTREYERRIANILKVIHDF